MKTPFAAQKDETQRGVSTEDGTTETDLSFMEITGAQADLMFRI